MAVTERLAFFRQAEIPLQNWFAAAFPAAPHWEKWLSDVTGAMLQRPAKLRVRLERSNKVEPKWKGEDLVLEDEPLTFGRDETNKVLLPEQTITRFHARLLRKDGRVLLEDLDSAMGTMVNDRRLDRLTSVELGDGDEFVIFPHRFVARIKREWEPARDVQLGQVFQCAAGAAEFHSRIPSRWSSFALTIEPIGATISLIADDPFLEGLCSRALAPLELPCAGITPGHEAIIELLLLAAIERANRDLAMPFQFSLGRRGVISKSDGDGFAVGITVNIGGLSGAIRVFLPRHTLERMQAAWGGLRPVVPAEIGWRLPVSAGSVELTRDECEGLEPGDVILYESSPAILFPGRDDQGWLASVTASGQYKVERRILMEDVSPLDELPLRLHILIDEKELTWAEVSNLTPGVVLDLQRDPRDAVKLAVNGRLLGTGELVEIEGRLGVKLISWGRTLTTDSALVDFLRVVIVLAGVLSLALACLRWVLPRFVAPPAIGPIQVIARQSLEARKTLFLVRAGGRELLLAASESGVSLLREWESPDGN